MAKFEPVLIHPLALAADCGRVGVLQDETSWVRVLLKIWQKGVGERNEAGKVDLHFLVKRRQIKVVEICQIVRVLHPSIKYNGINIWRFLHHPICCPSPR